MLRELINLLLNNSPFLQGVNVEIAGESPSYVTEIAGNRIIFLKHWLAADMIKSI